MWSTNTGVKMEYWQLKQRQSLPLEAKINHSKQVIRQWYEENDGMVYVAFSGGKDSTVLLDLVRSIYPDTPAVFIDTGLEYPEIRDFVKTFDNVEWSKPEKNFQQILKEDGYPVVSKRVAGMLDTIQNPTGKNNATINFYLTGEKRNGKISKAGKLQKKWRFLLDADFKISNKCCTYMKKKPADIYMKKTGRVPYIGMLAADSKMRTDRYLKVGCNSFATNKSTPLSIWKTEDIWEYIKIKNLPYCKVYDLEDVHGTGCVFCMFGMDYDPLRFSRLKETHPKLHAYCMDVLGLRKILKFMKYPTEPIPKVEGCAKTGFRIIEKE